jgi:Domain of unknown function (DUF4440)
MPERDAELSEQQLHEAIGEFAVDETSARLSGLAAEEIGQIRQAVWEITAESVKITAKYNEIAKRTGADPAMQVAAAEVEADRARLDRSIADDYTFVNPFGHTENKERTIEVILSGLVQFDSIGRDGFETIEESLHIHGPTVVLISTLKMSGSGETKNLKTGEVHETDFTGTYRTTHTYVFEDERWKLHSSQMTEVQPEGAKAVIARSRAAE